MLPTADLVATSPEGEVPLTTAFLASGSRDIDGYIARYEWDLDGDAAYEYDSGGDPSVIYKYTEPGTYIVSVRVTDDRGGTAEANTEIIAIPIFINQPPVAELQGSPPAGDAPLQVFFDASGSYDLDGYSTDGNGYFVLGNAAVSGVDLVFSDNGLQNGADAVALYTGGDTDFPNGTPVTTSNSTADSGSSAKPQSIVTLPWIAIASGRDRNTSPRGIHLATETSW